MKKSREPSSVRDIRLGRDVCFDAWLYSMLMDNNLAYRMNPDIIASPEQLAFMIQLDDNQVYLPCSDATFAMLPIICCRNCRPSITAPGASSCA